MNPLVSVVQVKLFATFWIKRLNVGAQAIESPFQEECWHGRLTCFKQHESLSHFEQGYLTTDFFLKFISDFARISSNSLSC